MNTISSILSEKKEGLYYYYEGRKKYLSIASDKLLIGFKSAKSNIEKRNLTDRFLAVSSDLDKEHTLKLIGDGIKDRHLVIYLNRPAKDDFDSGEWDKVLKEQDEVSYISPLLYTDNRNEMVGFTDEILLALKEGTSINDFDIQLRELGVEKAVPMELSYNKEFLLILESKSKYNALEVANILYETNKFEYSTPSFFRMIQPFAVPNDTLYPSQSNLNSWFSGSINIENAWNLVKGAGIRIAIMDVAILTTHTDLASNIVPGYDPTGQPIGFDEHGTWTAGVVGAVTDNNLGVAGVSFNSSIIPVRVGYTPYWGASALITNDTWVVQCFNECRTNLSADVINCSFNLGTPSSSVTSAINNASTNGRGGPGCVICVSTGNSNNSSIGYPSNLSSVIAVGATDPYGYRASFSNFGSGIDISAPGTQIITTDRLYGYTDFAPLSGTSFACPAVAGAAALVLATAPQLNSTQVRQILCRNAAKTGGYNYVNGVSNELGWGRLNVYPAIQDTIRTAWQIDGANYLCNNQQELYSVHNLPAGMIVVWSAVDGLTIDSNTGMATAQLPSELNGSLAVIIAHVNNGITTIPSIRRIPIGAYQGELFAQGRVVLPSGDVNSWAPVYGFIQLQNNNYNTGVNYINFGYAPYTNETTERPPYPGQTWSPGGITDIQVVNMPSGWTQAIPYIYTLSVGCLDASGYVEVNLLTPCGWCNAIFMVNGFD